MDELEIAWIDVHRDEDHNLTYATRRAYQCRQFEGALTNHFEIERMCLSVAAGVLLVKYWKVNHLIGRTLAIPLDRVVAFNFEEPDTVCRI